MAGRPTPASTRRRCGRRAFPNGSWKRWLRRKQRRRLGRRRRSAGRRRLLVLALLLLRLFVRAETNDLRLRAVGGAPRVVVEQVAVRVVDAAANAGGARR